MPTDYFANAARLSDGDLLSETKILAKRDLETCAELIAHLWEIEKRGTYVAEGYGSLYAYCRWELRLSGHAYFNRIEVSRVARRFPMILELLADGSVNLTAVRLLAPHLTAENHRAVLAEATGRTTREVKALVARLAPKPDVPATIRKLPTPAPVAPAKAEAAPANLSLDAPSAASLGTAPPPPAPQAPPPKRPIVEPLAPERYRIQFTVDQETHDDLRRVQELLRREIPNGDLGIIFGRAIKLLRKEVERKKLATTSRPRASRGVKPGSRHTPAAVKRGVLRRDGEQCAFVARNGRRCTERVYLEFHHRATPYALGGEMTVDNIAIHCRRHNVYEAEKIFGRFDPSRVRETQALYSVSRQYVQLVSKRVARFDAPFAGAPP